MPAGRQRSTVVLEHGKSTRSKEDDMHGLIIGAEPIEMILDKLKTWEIRGKNTSVRGRIALIKSRTKTVVGFADLVGVLGPLSMSKMRKNASKHRSTAEEYRNGFGYEKIYAWQLENVERLNKPIPYKHPSGAVIWVLLPDNLEKQT
jgi:ASCH domain